MFRKAILVSEKGNVYYSSHFTHAGLKKEHQMGTYIFKTFKGANFSTGTPFRFNQDGRLPHRVMEELVIDGNQILLFRDRREYHNFKALNKLEEPN